MATSRRPIVAHTSERVSAGRGSAPTTLERTRATATGTEAYESMAISATLLGAFASGPATPAKLHLLRLRRGYDDGYNGRSQYGLYSNGSYSILGDVLRLILDLQRY